MHVLFSFEHDTWRNDTGYRTLSNLTVVIGRKAETGSVIPWLRFEKRRNPCNLVSEPKQVLSREHTSASSGQLAVPKLLFTNICSLGQTKSRVRAVVALEADLRNNKSTLVLCRKLI